MSKNYPGYKNKNTLFDYINYALMIILSAMFIYPILNTLAISFSNAQALSSETVFVLPKGYTLASYKSLLTDASIIRYYANTILYALTGTVLTLLFTALMAYPLIFNELKGRKFVSIMLLITMFFGGGLIPTYLAIKSYKMIDTIWAMILPGAISAWNVMMLKTSFLSVPVSIRDAASIDGAGHFRILFQIMLPSLKAMLATLALFTIVGFWNEYFNALIYLNSVNKMPIQMFLRKMVIEMKPSDNSDLNKVMEMVSINPRTQKAAATIITILPIICVYPFLQKYFAKGVMLGSIKA